MTLVRFITDGDGYQDEEGTHYDSVAELIQVGMLSQCMCGDVDANLRYIRDGLHHIARLTTDYVPGTDFIKWYRAWSPAWLAEGLELFGNDTSRQFFFYWADSEGLTEHGTSVPGWLTEKGRQLLGDLDECLSDDTRL